MAYFTFLSSVQWLHQGQHFPKNLLRTAHECCHAGLALPPLHAVAGEASGGRRSDSASSSQGTASGHWQAGTWAGQHRSKHTKHASRQAAARKLASRRHLAPGDGALERPLVTEAGVGAVLQTILGFHPSPDQVSCALGSNCRRHFASKCVHKQGSEAFQPYVEMHHAEICAQALSLENFAACPQCCRQA